MNFRTLLIFIALCWVPFSFGQAPIKGTNLWLTTPPVQATAGSIARFLTLSNTGVGETVTPTKLWDSVVMTGTVDSIDLVDSTVIGRSMFSLPNPGAITFPRFNADNTVTARSALGLKTDLSLENVNNTSDANKPVSTAQQAALDLKANLVALDLKANLAGPQQYTSSHSFDNLYALQNFASVYGGGFGGDNNNKGVVFDAYGTGGLVTYSTHETIASATTISPVKQVVIVSGTAAITTITAPGMFVNSTATTCGQITIIPTGAFTTTTSGNIAVATTAVVGKALIMTYLNSTGKWYPSY